MRHAWKYWYLVYDAVFHMGWTVGVITFDVVVCRRVVVVLGRCFFLYVFIPAKEIFKIAPSDLLSEMEVASD